MSQLTEKEIKENKEQMDLVNEMCPPKKKGGPYSKLTQKFHKSRVYDLYFKEGYTIVKIAEQIDLNKNTVSDYVSYWNSQIGSQFGEKNLGFTLAKQLESLQIQKQGLLEDMGIEDDLEKRIRIRKLLFEMEQKITGFILKIAEKNIQVGRFDASFDVTEDEIKELVNTMSKESQKSETRKGLLQRIIALKKCDLAYAECFFDTMRKLGLDLFEVKPSDYGDKTLSYNIASFASHRGFFKN